MKKLFIGLAAVSAFAAGSAQAATEAAKGTIYFNGTITADSCIVTSGDATSVGRDMFVAMGDVSSAALGQESNPKAGFAYSEDDGTGGNVSIGGGLNPDGTPINLKVQCQDATSVALELKPAVVSGKGIAVSGGAKEVQIMLMSGDQILDFTSGSQTLDSSYSGGSAEIPLAAYYTTKNGKQPKDVVPGVANAEVAYVLSYN